jgi:hypothetical protein
MTGIVLTPDSSRWMEFVEALGIAVETEGCDERKGLNGYSDDFFGFS